MPRLMTRLATVLLAAPLALAATAGAAHATSVTVPGCYGASTAIFCNVTVTVGVPAGVETYTTTIPVCVGTCQDVPLTLVRTTSGDPLQVCVSYTTYSGSYVSDCADVAAYRALLADVFDIAYQSVCHSPSLTVECSGSVDNLAYRIERIISG
jgi:hypothetical protein